MVAAAKKYDAASARALAGTMLLEEEHATVILAEEVRTVVALVEPPSPTLPPPPPALAGHAAPSDDDYEATVITNINVQDAGVQNICSRISVTLDLSSAHYDRWRDNILLTLGRYSLSDHLLRDTTSVGVPAWD
jgi:hypothetical protein